MTSTRRLSMRMWIPAGAKAVLVLFSLFAVYGVARAADPFPTSQQAISLAATREEGSIKLSWTLAPGVYLYRDKIAAKSGGRSLQVATPAGKTKDDPTFGPVEIYDANVSGTVDAGGLDRSMPLEVTYQGCAERGICYPPVTKQIDLQRIGQIDAKTVVSPTPEPNGIDLQDHVSDEAVPGASAESHVSFPAALAPNLTGEFTVVLAAFFGLGLLLALTPCVYPMIPILVGILARSGEALSPGRGLALSVSYVLAMATAYGMLGVAAAWSGQNLQTALQTPAALIVGSAIFVALALSMFDVFHFQAPTALSSRFAGTAARARGSVSGSALLGFVSALIVGPCVTPPLAAALVYVAQTGDVVRGSSALFALGLGTGAPLIAVGLFGAKLMPKSGPWLEAVKHGFGVVFLAVAVMLVGRVASPQVTVALWALFAIGLGVFLGAFDPIGRRSGAGERLSKAAGVAAVVYGAALVLGAASGAQDALRPLAHLAASPSTTQPRGSDTTVTSKGQLEAALASSKIMGRPSLLIFTAGWCSTCAENEKTMANSEALQAKLREFSVVKVDVTGNDAEAAFLMKGLGVVGPPTTLFFDKSGAEIAALRSIGPIEAADFQRRLTQADDA
jgi:thiol:disulfide interchange protein DsbD